jgi:hypothetical protein
MMVQLMHCDFVTFVRALSFCLVNSELRPPLLPYILPTISELFVSDLCLLIELPSALLLLSKVLLQCPPPEYFHPLTLTRNAKQTWTRSKMSKVFTQNNQRTNKHHRPPRSRTDPTNWNEKKWWWVLKMCLNSIEKAALIGPLRNLLI